jgi:hypothetical protein
MQLTIQLLTNYSTIRHHKIHTFKNCLKVKQEISKQNTTVSTQVPLLSYSSCSPTVHVPQPVAKELRNLYREMEGFRTNITVKKCEPVKTNKNTNVNKTVCVN